MLIWKIKFFLFKCFCKGSVIYIILKIFNPEKIKEKELETKPVRDLDRDIRRIKQEAKKLTNINKEIDSRLYRSPNLVSVEECKEAAKNTLKIRELEKVVHALHKERFEQLIFSFGE